MAYEPQIWNSGNPELSLEKNKENNAVLVAEKMNNIEQGIKTAHDEIANIELQKGDMRTKGYIIPEISLHHNVGSDTKTVSFSCYREPWAEWHGEGDLPIHIPYWKKNEVAQTLEVDYITTNASSFVNNKYVYAENTSEPFDSLFESYYEYSGFTGNPVYAQQQVEGSFLYEKYVFNTFVVFGGADETKTLQPVQLVVTIDSIVDEGGGSIG